LNLHRLVIAAQVREAAGFDPGADSAGLGLMRPVRVADS